jgi:hypothetical protein
MRSEVFSNDFFVSKVGDRFPSVIGLRIANPFDEEFVVTGIVTSMISDDFHSILHVFILFILRWMSERFILLGRRYF